MCGKGDHFLVVRREKGGRGIRWLEKRWLILEAGKITAFFFPTGTGGENIRLRGMGIGKER